MTRLRSLPPPPVPPAPFRPPPVSRFDLSAGVSVLALEVPAVPLVHLHWVTSAGCGRDPVGLEGLTALAVPLVKEDLRFGVSPAVAAERLGTVLQSGFDWDSTFVGCGVLTEDLDAAIELMGGLSAPPDWTPSTIELWRRRRLTGLAERRSGPATLADDAFARAVYGPGRYGSPQLGTAAGLKSVTVGHLRSWYAEVTGGSAATLVAIGSLDGNELASRLERRLARGMTPAPGPPLPAVAPPAKGRFSRSRVVLVDLPDAPHTELRFGCPGTSRSHEDFRFLEVLSVLLGGGYSSRLGLELRHRRGAVYDVRCQLAERLGPGPLMVSTAVASSSVAATVRVIRHEVGRLSSERIPDAEIVEALSFLLGRRPQRFQTAIDLAGWLRRLAIEGDVEASFSDPRQMGDVDAERLIRVARDYLHIDGAVLVAVGPAAEIRSQLEEFGEVSVQPAWNGRGTFELRKNQGEATRERSRGERR